jgi:uncharacterized protein
VEEIDAPRSAPVFRRKGELYLLILGTGRRQVMPGAELRRAFMGVNIALEAMDTGAAPAHITFCCGGRPLGAALIAVD